MQFLGWCHCRSRKTTSELCIALLLLYVVTYFRKPVFALLICFVMDVFYLSVWKIRLSTRFNPKHIRKIMPSVGACNSLMTAALTCWVCAWARSGAYLLALVASSCSLLSSFKLQVLSWELRALGALQGLPRISHNWHFQKSAALCVFRDEFWDSCHTEGFFPEFFPACFERATFYI